MTNIYYFLPLSVFWFFIFWLVGGVLFAIIALFRTTKLKKAQFSCVFTLWCLFCAIGAAHTGLLMGNDEIEICLQKAQGFVESFSAVIACGVYSMMITGAAWFILLFAGGLLLLLLSRAKNQSWVHEADKKEESDKVQIKKLIVE